MPCKFDIELFKSLDLKLDFKKYPYLRRWWYHMRSFTDSEISLLPVIHPSDKLINILKVYKKTADQQVCCL